MPYADIDGDGVPNVHDHCPETPGRPAFNGCPEDDPRGLPVSAQAEPEIDAFERIYFDSGESYLDGKARIALNGVFNYLDENPHAHLVVMGHADYVGSDPLNDALSERRCQAVVDYLVQRGIADGRLRIEFYGERLPTASNETEAGRQRNRRVELVLESGEGGE
ncbi:MAG: OmpA family protein [Bacteroidetes bacterium]|nr:MAG: OmpA family protein [Bacteroidota bacterium]